jgi:electron transfer flavoprotein beta subunit
MKIIVTVKWVGSADQAEASPDGSVSFAKAKAAVSEYDAVAAEVAKQLAASAPGSEIVGVTVGPKDIDTPLSRKAILSRGLDRLVMVADDGLQGSDSLQTATVLAKAIEKEGFDIVLTGDSSADLGDRQVAAVLGALLGVPVVTGASAVSAASGAVQFERKAADGSTETIEAAGPIVLSVASDAAVAAVPGMKDILGAAKKPADATDLAGLGAELPAGPEIIKAAPPAKSGRAATMIDASDPAAAAAELVAALRQRGAL